jgi:hypothetical protein
MHERTREGCTMTDELISTMDSIGTRWGNMAAYRECQKLGISVLVGYSVRVVAILVGCGDDVEEEVQRKVGAVV